MNSMTDTITLPRAVVEALVDPEEQRFVNTDYGHCVYCMRPFMGPPTTPNLGIHEVSCPVRLAQEALVRPQTEPWTITRRSPASLTIESPDQHESVFVKWDGCFEYHQQPWNPAETEDFIHVCDLDTHIATLLRLRAQIRDEWPERLK